MFEDQKPIPRMALKIGIAGFIGFGALATGMFVTRKGRHLVKEAWQGRERTRIEDRVLDLIWDDPRLARRDIDVDEIAPGHIEITGTVRSIGEGRRVIRLAGSVNGVEQIDNGLRVARERERTSSLNPAEALDRLRTARSTRATRRTQDRERQPTRRDPRGGGAAG
jgi:hypothetical protein